MTNKPFSRTEMKIMIYNKMQRGMSYDEAKKEVAVAIEQVRDNHEKVKKQEKEQENSKSSKEKFNEDFRKLK